MEPNATYCDGLLFLTGAPGRFVCTCGHVGAQSELVRCDGVWRHPAQLQARDHQRRMSPEGKAWFLVGALEAFAWLCFGLYVLYMGATWGWR